MSIDKGDKGDKGEKIAQLAVAFKHDPLGYVRHFFPWGEKDLSLSTGPREWQEWALDTIGKHLRNPATRFTPLRIAVSSGHSIGKILSNISMLDTPQGFREWGDIEVGDLVWSRDGNPTKVVAKYPYKDWEFYKITFSDGTFAYAGLEHQWQVTTASDRSRGRSPRVVTTKDMLDNLHRKYQIPLCDAVNYPEQKSVLHPYLMGYLLGNGSLRTASAVKVSCYDVELYDYMRLLLPDSCKFRGNWDKNYLHISADGSDGGNVILNELKRLGIHGKSGLEKFIPDFFKYNSVESRIDLLRGLMDSDGTISPRKGDNNRLGYKVQYSTSSSKLRDDVLWLVRSLGGVANYSTNRNNSGYGRNNDNYEIHINLPNNINPFHLKRKVDKYNDYVSTVKRSPIKVVRKIEFDHVGEGHCITVEASDSLYLANDFIVTHNSSCIAMISQWALSTCVGTKIRVTANTRDQLRDITFPEISKWFRLALNSDWWEVTNTQVASVDDAQRQEWWCHAVTWSENNTEAFAGLHNHGKRIVMIFDEASAVADEVWEVAEGAEKDENTEIIWIAFGNPTRATGRFRECFRKFKHRWVTRQIDARTVEGINKEQIERDIADYGEDSDYVKIRIKGQFPDTSTSQFISSKIVEEAIHREPESSLYDPLIMGVDIARQGDDSTVIVQRRGLDCKSIPIIKFQCDDTMETASRIASLWHQYQHDAIFLDLGAMGYGVYDRLKMLGIPCVGVQFGGKADRELSEGGVRYRNKRSEMWGYMKDWLRFGSIPDDEKLREELTSIEAKNITVGGLDVVALEEKAELKRRIGRSPDIADSLAISFAYSVAKRNHTEEIQGIYKNKGNQHKIDYEPL